MRKWGGSQGRDRKVREHLKILQTIAETEEKREKTGIFLQKILVFSEEVRLLTPSFRNLFTVDTGGAAHRLDQY